VADFRWRVNLVKSLISSYLHNLCHINFDLGSWVAAGKPPSHPSFGCDPVILLYYEHVAQKLPFHLEQRLFVVFILLGDFPAPEFYMPTFRNTLRGPKRLYIKFRRRVSPKRNTTFRTWRKFEIKSYLFHAQKQTVQEKDVNTFRALSIYPW